MRAMRTALWTVLLMSPLIAGLAVGAPVEDSPGFLSRDKAGPRHAGHVRDLGEFYPSDINERGQITGGRGGHAFLWDRGTFTDLGVLGGPIPYSNATALNNRAQVVGTTTVDGSSAETQQDGFIWEHGVMDVLGTADAGYTPGYSYPASINERSQVVGASRNSGDVTVCRYSNRCFFWQNGVTTDLGTLGGCECNVAHAKWGQRSLNKRGQVVGRSFDASGTARPFLWEGGVMTDLGTFLGPGGGPFVSADAINNRGQVVGISDSPPENTDPYVPASGGPSHVFLWNRGEILDLPIRGRCVPIDDFFCEYRPPQVRDINDRGQVIGIDGEGHGFLWERGVVTDLGTFWPFAINERGQIVGGSHLWENGTLIDLGMRPMCIGAHCVGPEATEINDRGQVIGTFPFAISGNQILLHGFLWERTPPAPHH